MRRVCAGRSSFGSPSTPDPVPSSDGVALDPGRHAQEPPLTSCRISGSYTGPLGLRSRHGTGRRRFRRSGIRG